MRSSETPWKFVLLGGDGVTAATYRAAAAHEGHRLDYFSSMHDIGYLGRLREYDAAIVHGDMYPLSGLEVAEYLEKLFQSLPMILLTPDEDMDAELDRIPSSVVDRYPASEEAHTVLHRVIQILRLPLKQRSRFLLALERG
jgi:DNA-binding response OmpR family regulator